jgi:hypothetical protein
MTIRKAKMNNIHSAHDSLVAPRNATYNNEDGKLLFDSNWRTANQARNSPIKCPRQASVAESGPWTSADTPSAVDEKRTDNEPSFHQDKPSTTRVSCYDAEPSSSTQQPPLGVGRTSLIRSVSTEQSGPLPQNEIVEVTAPQPEDAPLLRGSKFLPKYLQSRSSQPFITNESFQRHVMNNVRTELASKPFLLLDLDAKLLDVVHDPDSYELVVQGYREAVQLVQRRTRSWIIHCIDRHSLQKLLQDGASIEVDILVSSQALRDVSILGDAEDEASGGGMAKRSNQRAGVWIQSLPSDGELAKAMGLPALEDGVAILGVNGKYCTSQADVCQCLQEATRASNSSIDKEQKVSMMIFFLCLSPYADLSQIDASKMIKWPRRRDGQPYCPLTRSSHSILPLPRLEEGRNNNKSLDDSTTQETLTATDMVPPILSPYASDSIAPSTITATTAGAALLISDQSLSPLPRNESDSDHARQVRTGTTPTSEGQASREPPSTVAFVPFPDQTLPRPALRFLDEKKVCSDILADYESVEVDLVVSATLPLGSRIKKHKKESKPSAIWIEFKADGQLEQLLGKQACTNGAALLLADGTPCTSVKDLKEIITAQATDRDTGTFRVTLCFSDWTDLSGIDKAKLVQGRTNPRRRNGKSYPLHFRSKDETKSQLKEKATDLFCLLTTELVPTQPVKADLGPLASGSDVKLAQNLRRISTLDPIPSTAWDDRSVPLEPTNDCDTYIRGDRLERQTRTGTKRKPDTPRSLQSEKFQRSTNSAPVQVKNDSDRGKLLESQANAVDRVHLMDSSPLKSDIKADAGVQVLASSQTAVHLLSSGKHRKKQDSDNRWKPESKVESGFSAKKREASAALLDTEHLKHARHEYTKRSTAPMFYDLARFEASGFQEMDI